MHSHPAESLAEANRAALVQANRRRLNGCGQHVFDCMPIDWANKIAPETLRCRVCGGILRFEEAAQYAKGFAAAGGNPEHVIEGFGR